MLPPLDSNCSLLGHQHTYNAHNTLHFYSHAHTPHSTQNCIFSLPFECLSHDHSDFLFFKGFIAHLNNPLYLTPHHRIAHILQTSYIRGSHLHNVVQRAATHVLHSNARLIHHLQRGWRSPAWDEPDKCLCIEQHDRFCSLRQMHAVCVCLVLWCLCSGAYVW